MTRRLAWLAATLCGAGCLASDTAGFDTDGFVDEDLPAGGCNTECPTPGTDTSAVDGPCLNSSNCMGNAVCVAPFDGEVGAFMCSEACIEFDDDQRWCVDAMACCDPNAICTSRGFCIPGGNLDSTGTTGDDMGTTGDSTGTTGTTGDMGSGTTDTMGSTGDTEQGGSTTTGGI